MKITQTYFVVFIIAFLFNEKSECYAQHSFDVSAGIGDIELINAGLRYQLSNRIQIGIKGGTFPSNSENSISISGNAYYHFAGYSKLSDQPPWYTRIGINYLKGENEKLLEKYLFLDLRIGRDINITEKIGIKLDGGIVIQMKKTYVHKVSTGWNFNFDIPVIPGLGIELFYRI